MNVQVKDTGNAMTDEEIIYFSSRINIPELRNYRIAVGRNTREIISGFKTMDLKRFCRHRKSKGKHLLHGETICITEI